MIFLPYQAYKGWHTSRAENLGITEDHEMLDNKSYLLPILSSLLERVLFGLANAAFTESLEFRLR